MLSPTTLATVRAQVAWRLGCAPEDLARGRTLVQAHGSHFAAYHGIYAWLMGDVAILSAPPEWLEAMRAAAATHPREALADPAFWQGTLGTAIERIVGPSYQGYVDASAFRPAPPLPSLPARAPRPLTPADLPALAQLATACPPEEWEHSAIQPHHAPIFAVERDGALVAAASAPDDGPGVASVGVVTAPAWRGKGYGRAVVGALTADRLAAGYVVHYQTLRSNIASVAIARALGYTDLATAVAVRLIHPPATA